MMLKQLKMKIYQKIKKNCAMIVAMVCHRNQKQHCDRQITADQKQKELKTKLFRKVKSDLTAMGFSPNKQQSDSWKLSSSQIASVTLYSTNCVLVGFGVFWAADSFEECMNPIFWLTVLAGASIAFTSVIFKNDKLFNAIKLVANEECFSKCVRIE